MRLVTEEMRSDRFRAQFEGERKQNWLELEKKSLFGFVEALFKVSEQCWFLRLRHFDERFAASNVEIEQAIADCAEWKEDIEVEWFEMPFFDQTAPSSIVKLGPGAIQAAKIQQISPGSGRKCSDSRFNLRFYRKQGSKSLARIV